MNKQQKLKKLLLIIVIVVLSALSFGPCIREINTYIIQTGDLLGDDSYVELLPYNPVLFCFVSIIEIILIITTNRRFFRIIGIVLHLFKMAVPFILYRMGLFLQLGGLVSTTYKVSWFGYILLITGIGVLVLYGFELKKPIRTSDGSTP